MAQVIMSGIGVNLENLKDALAKSGTKKCLLVCMGSFSRLPFKPLFDSLYLPFVIFSDFTPNPLYEDVYKGTELFRSQNCDTIVAVGGGSAMDVAKCIKLFCRMNPEKNYLKQKCFDSGIPLITVPTTAGTGSESTRFAVIYFEGEKQSVNHLSIIPDYAILEHSVLHSLPVYQKKCALLDALCQGIESWWSVNSTNESKRYSKLAVEMILSHMGEYLSAYTDEVASQIMLAANYAGRAINITQTTAAHAMSYKITSLYKVPHGHAAALCLPKVWRYMNDSMKGCIDPRGSEYMEEVFSDIAAVFGTDSVTDAIDTFETLLTELDMITPAMQNIEELEILSKSVNPIRLKNNPVQLDEITLKNLYKQIFHQQ